MRPDLPCHLQLSASGRFNLKRTACLWMPCSSIVSCEACSLNLSGRHNARGSYFLQSYSYHSVHGAVKSFKAFVVRKSFAPWLICQPEVFGVPSLWAIRTR